MCVPKKSVLRSSREGARAQERKEQEARQVADRVSKCFNNGAGEVDHGILGSSASATALSRERQRHAYNISRSR